MPSIHFTDEHRMIRETIRRFLAEAVTPHGDRWEREGAVPRAVLRRMGELGLLGLTHAEEYGGSGLDARASVVLAEEVGRSTHGGFAITVLVHTDMASPHLLRFGNKRQLEKYLPDIMAGTRPSPRSASPSRAPARTWPASAPGRCATATTTS